MVVRSKYLLAILRPARRWVSSLLTKSWFAAIFALTIFYYAIPQLAITDSRYVLATADLLLRTGDLNLWPVANADTAMPLAKNGQLLVRATDIPPDILAAAYAAGVRPSAKGGAVDFFGIFDRVPGAADRFLAARPPVLPLFPTWPSFAVLPFSLVTAALRVPVFDGTTFYWDRNERYQKILAALLAAVTVGFFYGAARCLLPWPFALGLAAWLASGPLVSNTSRALWSDTFALPLSFAGLYIFTRVILAGRPMRYWPVLLAAALSFAFMMKPTYAIPSAMLGLLVLLAPKVPLRLKADFVATCAICAALFTATSFLIYGDMLPPYFAPSRASSFEFSRLIGIFFSPGRGALWFTPSLFVACSAPFFVWRDRTALVASIVAVAAVAATVLTVGSWGDWWGGWAFGPRLLQSTLPAVALLALVLVHATNQRGGQLKVVVLALCSVVAGWEALVHISGVASARGYEWNDRPVNVDTALQRLWDWSDPQFLAALRKVKPDIIALPEDGWVRMASACSDHFAGDGVSGREPEFRWTDGNWAELLFAGAPQNASRFAIDVLPLVDTRYPAQHVTFAANGTEIGRAVLTQPQWTRLEFDVPLGKLNQSQNTITLGLPDAHPPGNGSPDRRRLGVAIREFLVTAASDTSTLPVAETCR